jgi:hypothetical protein
MTGHRADPPPRILTRLRRLCLGLPEAYEETAWAGTRWMIRRRNFAHVVAIDSGWPPAYAKAAGSDGPVVVLTFRAAGMLYDVLRTTGAPFFAAAWGTRWGTKVIGMAIDRGTDWDQVAMLLTESYRLLAPRALAASLAPAPARSGRRAASPPSRAPRRLRSDRGPSPR